MCSGKCNSHELVLGEEHTAGRLDKDLKRLSKSLETVPLSPSALPARDTDGPVALCESSMVGFCVCVVVPVILRHTWYNRLQLGLAGLAVGGFSGGELAPRRRSDGPAPRRGSNRLAPRCDRADFYGDILCGVVFAASVVMAAG
jgi:hypothetical protein